MTSEVPVSRHLDLYRYWLSKRNGRSTPARRDLDPVEVPALLPYLMILQKVNGEFRYRLAGTSVVRDLGVERTGKLALDYVQYTPEMAAALEELRNRVFTTGQPVFAAGQYHTGFGTIHHASALLVPLSDDGKNVNMAMLTRLARFGSGVWASANWLENKLVNLHITAIHSVADLENCCLDWERVCFDSETHGTVSARGMMR
jgi:hypothetical protein